MLHWTESRRLHLFISRKIEMNLLRSPFNRSMPAVRVLNVNANWIREHFLRKETEIPVEETTFQLTLLLEIFAD